LLAQGFQGEDFRNALLENIAGELSEN
jgi:hypothetical protein